MAEAAGDGRLATVIDADGTRSGSGAGDGCPRCGSTAVGRWGRGEADRPRRRCTACGRTFTALTGTPLAGIHEPAAFRLVLEDMMQEGRSSCRALARRLGRDKSTIWRWRRRIIEAFAAGAGQERGSIGRSLGTGGAGTVERLRESRKASREWVNHARDPERHPAPDRPRWVDVDSGRLLAPEPLSLFQVAVLLAADGLGGGAARVVDIGGTACDRRVAGDRPAAPGCFRQVEATPGRVAERGRPAGIGAAAARAGAASPLWRADPRQAAQASGGIVRIDAVPGGADRRPGSGAEAGEACSAMAPAGWSDPPIEGPVAASSTLSRVFKGFLGPFRGPSTRYLHGYVAWFSLAASGTKQSRLAAAWLRLLGRPPTEFADIMDPGTPGRRGARSRATGQEAGGFSAGAAWTFQPAP
jgi:transposase-like protein